MGRRRIDFARELGRGLSAYQDRLASWWLDRTADAAHRRAYRRIADYIADSFPRPPRRITDYGCGAGHLLAQLARRFPRARLSGYDASGPLLDSARRRLAFAGRRVDLAETVLPDSSLPRGACDLVTMSFPNLLPPAPAGELRRCEQRLSGAEREAARALSAAGTDGYARLLYDRVLAHDVHRLLRRGGICVRVEYCGARREDIARRDLERLELAEGSLADGAVRPFFRVVASRYVRSRVIEDVFQQSRRRADRTGGYSITILRSL